MLDVTKLFNNYRETVRHIWNTYFVHYEIQQERFFGAIEESLFVGMVLCLLDSRDTVFPQPRNLPLKGFTLISRYPRTQLHVGTPRGGHAVDWELLTLTTTNLTIGFIWYFDWTQPMEYRDLEFYQGLVETSPDAPELIGKHVLIRVQDATVYFSGRPLYDGPLTATFLDPDRLKG